MARLNGTVLRLEITPLADIEGPDDLAGNPTDFTVYVSDAGSTPHPGLGYTVEDGSMATIAVVLGKTEASRYLFATTGSYT